MYDCQTLLKLLYPYLDNELDVKEALRVQIHLDECARCRGLFEKERIFLEALREGFPAERAPASLRGRIREEIADEVPAGEARFRWGSRFGAGWGSAVRVASLLAVFFLFGAGGFFLFSKPAEHPEALTWVDLAVEAHAAVVADQKGLDVRESDPAALSAWFEGKVDVPFSLPAETGSIEMIGGRIEHVGALRVPLIVFRTGGEISSLLLGPPQPMAVGDKAAERGTLSFYTLRHHGYDVIAWSDANVSYLLVANHLRAAKEGCLLCHADEPDRNLM